MRRFLHDHRMATRRRTGGFTLIELLVVIGILGLLAILTVISAQKLSKSSRVSAATNAVTSTLQVARAYAIRENKLTVVVFRPIWDINNRQRPQQTEMLVAAWTGETFAFNTYTDGQKDLADRFLPVNGIKTQKLPAGIKVGGPLFEDGEDGNWVTQGEMQFIMQGCKEGIKYSRMAAVMFAPDGSLVTANPRASGKDTKSFVDFNLIDSNGNGDLQDCETAAGCATGNFQTFWMQDSVDDECNLTVVPFLAVYDDRAAREVKALDWSNDGNMAVELCGTTGYISTNGQRIHFNRYTGVAEVQQ
jgi:prepilin-type N-terminal cleavage/methylation domain-containing protein